MQHEVLIASPMLVLAKVLYMSYQEVNSLKHLKVSLCFTPKLLHFLAFQYYPVQKALI